MCSVKRCEKFISELKKTHLNDRLTEDTFEVLCPTVPSSVSSNERLRVQKRPLDRIMKGLHCWCALTKTEYLVIFQNSDKVSSC